MHPLQEEEVVEVEEEVEAEAEVEAEEEVEAAEDKQIPPQPLPSDSAETPQKSLPEKERKQTASSPNSKHYYLANIGVAEFNSWIRKVVIACTYIQGPLVDKWVDRAIDWLSRLDPLIDDIEDV